MQVNNFQRVVAERGHEEPPAFEVHCKMVKTPLDVWQGNCLHQPKRHTLLGLNSDYQYDKCSQKDCMECPHHFLLPR